MSSLSELIARVEKASGQSRELDGLIFKVVFEKPGDVWSDDFGGWHRQDPDDHCAFEPPPSFTASIDTALTLVPEGMGFNLQGNTNLFYAVVAGQYSKPTTTPALALVAACLKARLLDAASSEAADQ